MKDVSCKVFEIIFRELDIIHVPPEILCQGIPYHLEYLLDGRKDMEWDVFCRALANTRSIWNDDDYVRLGIQLVEWRLHPFLKAVLGFLVNTREMYRLITSPKKGLGDQYFRCITATLEEIDKQHLNILLELPSGYGYSREFFLITKGFFTAAPGLLKYGHSGVIMQETDRGALYRIVLPMNKNPFTWFRQLLSYPTSKLAALQEMTKAHELLYERYHQLEESRAQIQRQARRLETAHSIGTIIRKKLDLDATLTAVAESLVEGAGFTAVEIKVHCCLDRNPVIRIIRKGEMMAMEPTFVKTLDVHGNSIGTMNLWCPPGASPEDTVPLLDMVIPPITMEIMNAISFRMVNDYRKKLENRVGEIQSAILEERRRISRELHDDLGTNLSTIALMSGVMKVNAPADTLPEISRMARQSMDKISEIVWSLNPNNDKMENLVAYIRRYAMGYFEPTLVKCIVTVPREIPDFVIEGELRRNIFYTIKEALHNIIKHSQATEAELHITISGHLFSVTIRDNGKGLPHGELNRFGNGLVNMQNRINSIHGQFSIKNHNGTKIRLMVPFDEITRKGY